MSVFIIAEAGVNHNGKLELAKKLVDMAVDCGADAIKFQTFKAHEITGAFAEKAEYQKENCIVEETQYEMIKKLELPFEDFREIQNYCNNRGILFLSTPDGDESLKFLMKLDVPLIKVGSTEITNHDFLIKIGKTEKPIILSTGMSTLGEIEEAIDVIKTTGNRDIRILQCTTDYPTRYEDVNLRAMVTMKAAFNFSVGISDHTLSNEVAVAAVALGASIIEKHITLNKEMEGPDHRASMSPQEFKSFVQSIRNTEKLLGDGIKKPSDREKEIMKNVRRSIVAANDLDEGVLITKDMLNYKRPGNGIMPKYVNVIEGRILKRSLKKDEVIKWEDI